MLKEYARLIRRLPAVLNFAWLVMHLGVGILIAGFLQGSTRASLIGFGLLLLGWIISVLDMSLRRGDRTMTALFATKLFVSQLAALVMVTLVGLCTVVAMVVLAVLGEFSWEPLLRSLHFFGICIAFFLVTGIPNAAAGVREALNLEPEEA